LCLQFGDAVAYDVQNQVIVDAEIIVNEPIAHAGHGTPLDVWMALRSSK